ncbi:glycine-rich domain-containing protein [Streptomyces sp. NRRL F-5630]|uniref:glycine-rich domain-containing protein n=1 Tax=Streptomyces sp. NRRL F-5630 TaxID=1463864 RepID=UPI003D71F10E
MTSTIAHPVGATDPSTLLDRETRNRLANRITADHPDITPGMAQRIVNQTLAFVATSGRTPGQGMSPSRLVDIGWHTFILHTVDYARYCERVASRFVHHVPTENAGETPGEAAAVLTRTMSAIEDAGFTLDTELWLGAADCSQCHEGCTDSPNNPKK